MPYNEIKVLKKRIEDLEAELAELKNDMKIITEASGSLLTDIKLNKIMRDAGNYPSIMKLEKAYFEVIVRHHWYCTIPSRLQPIIQIKN